jgi:hypothetical protein
MFSISRCVLRWGLIGAAGLGATAFMVGPDRLAAGFDQLRMHAETIADDFVDDPVALRRQLAGLAEKYPDRIAEVRAEIGEIDRQLVKLEQDHEVASRVVSMTSSDLADFRLALGESEIEAAAGRGTSIQVSGRVFDAEGARKEATRIHGIRATYRDRQATDEAQLEFLGTQKSRLGEILTKLEEEHGRYQAKLWQLDQQIDAIARNERLIEMTKEQQAILAEYNKFTEVGSLDQLESKLAELKTIQEAQLQTLARGSGHDDYEDAARDSLRHDEWDFEDVLFDPAHEPAPRGHSETSPVASLN